MEVVTGADRKALALIMVYLLAAVVLVHVNHGDLGWSDAKRYVRLADQCVREGAFYPSERNIYDRAIYNPGYVNFIAALRYAGLEVKSILYLNVALSTALLYVLYRTAKEHFGGTVYPLLMIYVLYPRSYALNLNLYSEVPFALLSCTALFFYLRGDIKSLSLSGSLLALANWIRPSGGVFIIPFLLFALVGKEPKRRLAAFALPMLLTIALLGSASYLSSGYFIFQSVTLGDTLIQGANPGSTGAANQMSVFEKGSIGHIPEGTQMTFKERDRFWKNRAIGWIKEHPLEYLGLFFNKVWFTYNRDSWGIGKLADTTLESDEIHRLPDVHRAVWYAVQIYNQLVYMALVALALLSVWFGRDLAYRRPLYLAHAIIVTGTLFVGFIIGDGRYKYPVVPALLLSASFAAGRLLEGRKGAHRLSGR